MTSSVVSVIGLCIIVLLVGLDIFFSLDNVAGNTWSELVRRFAKHTPLIPFVCGVLSGHFFWPAILKENVPLLGQPNSIALLIWTGCAVGMIGLALSKFGITFPLWLAFVFGCVGGTLLWPVGKW